MGQGVVVARLGAVLVVASFIACSTPPPPTAAEAETTTPAAVPQEAAPMTPTELAKHALSLFDAKRYDEAVPALAEAAKQYPEVAPFLRLRIVEAEVARGNLQNAASTAAEIIALGGNSAATVARLRLPAIYAQLGDTAATDAAWQQANAVAIDELTEPDIVSMATALAKAGRTDLATRTRMRLLQDYTQGRYTEQTYGFLKPEIAKLTVDEKLALAGKLSRANRYDQALELFAQIPGDLPAARATRLRALFNSRNYEQLLAETQNTPLADPALILLRARAAWRSDRPQELLSGLAEIEQQFPTSREAAEAQVIRAKYYVTDSIDYAKSIENLSKAIEAGAHGNDGENLWNLGWTYTLWGRYDDALKTFDRYIRTYPDGDWKTNSLFWSAKIYDKLGRTQERDAKAAQIVAEYPFSYYAYRAKELWFGGAAAASAAGRPGAAGPTRFPDIAALPADPAFAVVRALEDVGLHRAAAREMKLLAAKYPEDAAVQFMLADVYVRGGEPFKANGVLQRNFRQFVRHGGANIPRRFWEILYPLPYFETFQAQAAVRNLDPYLLASITRQESGFEPTTVSNAGAVGLMQIMPQEASRIAAAGGLGAITREDLFDPHKNIAVGAAEFSQKLAHWNGNHILAIASYNAGESAVGTWLEKTPVDDIDLFVEAIPYAETRLYVKTVTRNRFEYRRIYEVSTAVPAETNATQ
ncbi:MAG TPA: transglycosylase SLT domain-containing protein [Thermoanaerobaculia bacterium]|nr:transglycosylase SLT domain-containing protein [Thermoanaerobaculia bacterium]